MVQVNRFAAILLMTLFLKRKIICLLYVLIIEGSYQCLNMFLSHLNCMEDLQQCIDKLILIKCAHLQSLLVLQTHNEAGLVNT